MKNIERKYALADETRHAEIAGVLAARVGSPATLAQTDVYYACLAGARLKLRLEQRDDLPPTASLIAYARDDANAARPSHWALFRLGDRADVAQATVILGATLREDVRVVKRRQLWLWDDVRVHLDVVEGLGWFVEFEDVLQAGADEAAAHKRLADMAAALGLDRGATPQALGYRELMLARRPAGGGTD